uniref:Inward rectifier potassium channel 2like [Bombyx mori] n=3 Tax=Lepeophtheirus salmonis TaxID=72036 RepID=A0A0K2U965_LEPSM
MCLQSIIGVVISACMAGIVFAKLARPKLRSNTILYSKNAVITMRNDELYLLFRVGNMRKSHLIEAHLRAQLVYDRSFTDEGENMHYKHEELSICTQADWNSEDRTLIIWPIIIAHKIDEESPFFSMSPKDILSSRFEIIVSLEGVVEPTGNSVQALSSYLPNEILWGYHFDNMMSYSRKRGVYIVDCAHLNALIQDDTPRISAKELKEINSSKSTPSTIKFSECNADNVSNAHV